MFHIRCSALDADPSGTSQEPQKTPVYWMSEIIQAAAEVAVISMKQREHISQWMRMP